MYIFILRLEYLIKQSGKLQKDICEDLNVSKQKLSKWKTGYNEPSLEELALIANYFDVPSDFLLGLSEQEFSIEQKSNPDPLIEISKKLNPKAKQMLLQFAMVLAGESNDIVNNESGFTWESISPNNK